MLGILEVPKNTTNSLTISSHASPQKKIHLHWEYKSSQTNEDKTVSYYTITLKAY